MSIVGTIRSRSILRKKRDHFYLSIRYIYMSLNTVRIMQHTRYIPAVHVEHFGDIVEKFMEVFMDDFSVFGSNFDIYLDNLQKVLKRCEEKNLVLNWEKCHFMVIRGTILGHKILTQGVQVNKGKINLISGLCIPKFARDICSFLGHAVFYRCFIKDSSVIS